MSFLRRNKYTLRKSSSEAFRLQTQDLAEGKAFFSKPHKRGSLSHLLSAGGTKATRSNDATYAVLRSWNRFYTILTILIVLWLLGFFLP